MYAFTPFWTTFAETAVLSFPIEKKVMELKLTGIAQNRSKIHTEETTTDKGVHVGIFFIENSLALIN